MGTCASIYSRRGKIKTLSKAAGDEHCFKQLDKDEDLILACRSGDVEKVEHLLQRGSDVNAVDENGRNCLMIASEIGHKQIVELLIKSDSDINAVDNNGMNALKIASSKGHEKIAEILMKSDTNNRKVENDRRNKLMKKSPNKRNNMVGNSIAAGNNLTPVKTKGKAPSLPILPKETAKSRVKKHADQTEAIHGQLREKHRKLLQKETSYLLEEIDAADIVADLFSKFVISLDDRIRVQGEKTPRARTNVFIDILFNAGPKRAFPEFLIILEKKYPVVAKRLNSQLICKYGQ